MKEIVKLITSLEKTSFKKFSLISVNGKYK